MSDGEDKIIMCRCGRRGKESHTCPYGEDIHNDSKTMCNCCDRCRDECSDDI